MEVCLLLAAVVVVDQGGHLLMVRFPEDRMGRVPEDRLRRVVERRR